MLIVLKGTRFMVVMVTRGCAEDCCRDMLNKSWVVGQTDRCLTVGCTLLCT